MDKLIELVSQMHTIENMYATLIIIGYTMLMLTIGMFTYFYYHKTKYKWLSISIIVILWVFGVSLLQIWCVDMGWITSSGDMTNMTVNKGV